MSTYEPETYIRLVGHKHCGSTGEHGAHEWRTYRGDRLVEVHRCNGAGSTPCRSCNGHGDSGLNLVAHFDTNGDPFPVCKPCGGTGTSTVDEAIRQAIAST